jgi:hypothetical protein
LSSSVNSKLQPEQARGRRALAWEWSAGRAVQLPRWSLTDQQAAVRMGARPTGASIQPAALCSLPLGDSKPQGRPLSARMSDLGPSGAATQRSNAVSAKSVEKLTRRRCAPPAAADATGDGEKAIQGAVQGPPPG